MWAEIIVRYFHFIGIILVGVCLVTEHLMMKKKVDVPTLKRLTVIDGIYGLSAILTLSMGLLLWLVVGKPAEFYSSNPLMHVKLTLFVIIGLLSIKPTLWILKNSKAPADQTFVVPKSIIMIYRVSLLLYFAIPFLGTLIARGI